MAPPASLSRRKRRVPEEIRALILAAAVEEFQDGGYAGATTAAIARRAGVTETQIFRYFDTKAALFREAVFAPLNAHFADFLARKDFGEDALGAETRSYIDELQNFMGDHSRLLMSLVVAEAHGHEAGVSGRALEGLAAYFERGAANMRSRLGGRAEADLKVSPDLMVRVSFAAVLGCALFRDWIIPETVADPDAVRAAVIDFVMDGLNANG